MTTGFRDVFAEILSKRNGIRNFADLPRLRVGREKAARAHRLIGESAREQPVFPGYA
jgi:hypothetical protein